jgi:hypothetical protein
MTATLSASQSFKQPLAAQRGARAFIFTSLAADRHDELQRDSEFFFPTHGHRDERKASLSGIHASQPCHL